MSLYLLNTISSAEIGSKIHPASKVKTGDLLSVDKKRESPDIKNAGDFFQESNRPVAKMKLLAGVDCHYYKWCKRGSVIA